MVITVVIAWSSQIFGEVSRILIDPTSGWVSELVFKILIGILLAIAASLVAIVLHMRYRGFFKKRKKKVEDFEEG